MRTTVEIDDTLLAEARRCGKYSTTRGAVEAGLRLLVRQQTLDDFEAALGPGLFYPDYDYKAMRAAD